MMFRKVWEADRKDWFRSALKRLNKLTHKQVQMATAEVQRATHAIDERGREVEEQVPAVDASVDDEVTQVINGAQLLSSSVLT